MPPTGDRERACTITRAKEFGLGERNRRGWIAAIVACTLLIPIGATSAGPTQKLDRTQRQLDVLRARITEHTARAADLRERIASLNRAMTEVQIAINDLDANVARIRASVHSSRARIRRLRAETRALKAVATAQAVMLYKSGGPETLDAFLDAGSIIEFNDRIEMLGIATRENTGALVRYGRLRVSIEAENRILFARQDRLRATRRAHARVLEEHNRLKARLASDLRALRRAIGVERNHEGHLEHAAAALKKRIVAAQARSAVAALGMSSEGFVWPLNGPVTSPYGPRWGSVHTGIDIDGYTGQPIVASKAGVVIYVGAGMAGYGETVVLDHGGGISTLYAHMSRYTTSADARVDQGQIIGSVGCTGTCFGDHLHFEVRLDGNPVDPLTYLP
jgi:murein DD-endopeptidase MepM/ murein hydrolase activator NlpD